MPQAGAAAKREVSLSIIHPLHHIGAYPRLMISIGHVICHAKQLVKPALDVALGHTVEVSVDVQVLASLYRQACQLVQLFNRAHRCVVRAALEARLRDLP